MAKLPYYHFGKKYAELGQPPSIEDLNLWAAIDLAREGFYVFPVGDDKKPVPGESWKKTSTNDLAKVNLIWTKFHPGKMPAIDLAKSGHIVIDLDRHGGPDGIASWKELARGRIDFIRDIPAVNTPSQGRHLYWRQREGELPLGNREGQLKGLGINVRGSGGYVVGAGAVRGDGTFYDPKCRLNELYDAPELPGWLADMIRADEVAPQTGNGGQPQNTGESLKVASDGDRPNKRDLAALERELEDLRSCPKGSRNNQLNDTAFNIAQLANDGAFNWGDVRGRIEDAAHACGLVRDKGMPAVHRTMASAYQAARKKPKKLNPLHGETATQNANEIRAKEPKEAAKTAAPKKSVLPQIYRVSELKHKHFLPPRWLCEGILCEGSAILGGRPKMGKSWFALDLARGIATGTDFMGKPCAKGDVLYIALEDNQRRLKNRYEKIALENEWDCELSFANDWPKGEEAVSAIHEWRESSINPVLVIVDTLQKVKAPAKGKNGDSYASDYAALEILQKFYIDTGISVFMNTHTTKFVPDDPFDSITGTLGQTAAVDNLMVMAKDKSGTVTLHGKGRDMEEYSNVVKFNRETAKWELGGDYDAVVSSGIQKKIMMFLAEQSGSVTPSEVADSTGFSRNAISTALGRMVEKGLIEKDGRGKYLLVFGREIE